MVVVAVHNHHVSAVRIGAVRQSRAQQRRTAVLTATLLISTAYPKTPSDCGCARALRLYGVCDGSGSRFPNAATFLHNLLIIFNRLTRKRRCGIRYRFGSPRGFPPSTARWSGHVATSAHTAIVVCKENLVFSGDNPDRPTSDNMLPQAEIRRRSPHRRRLRSADGGRRAAASGRGGPAIRRKGRIPI